MQKVEPVRFGVGEVELWRPCQNEGDFNKVLPN